MTEALSGLSSVIGTIPASDGQAMPGQDAAGNVADIVTEAVNVLMSLGITRSEASQAVMNVSEEYASVEDCVRLALKGM